MRSLRKYMMVAAVIAAGMVFAVSNAIASGPAAPPSDWVLTLRARNALWEKGPLSKLNIGVTVQNGVARLHGSAPSASLVDEATATIKSLSGVREVVNEMHVPALDVLDPPTPQTSDSLRPASTLETNLPQPKPELSGTPTARFTPPPSVEAAPPPPTLAERIAEIRNNDRRFHYIRFEIQNGRVILRGSVARSIDAWEFARAIGHLPGVSAVSQNIETVSPKR